jgi:hypothetical protein
MLTALVRCSIGLRVLLGSSTVVSVTRVVYAHMDNHTTQTPPSSAVVNGRNLHQCSSLLVVAAHSSRNVHGISAQSVAYRHITSRQAQRSAAFVRYVISVHSVQLVVALALP